MNRNHLTDHLVFLAILLLIAIFLPGAAISATLEVCPSCPFSTVRAAVKYAYPHDAIVIQSGILSGLVIRNSGMSYISEFAGIRVEESSGCYITDNRFEENTYSIYLAKVDTCTIARNRIIGNAQDEVSGGNGIHAWYSRNITALNNDISGHRDGLYLEFTPDSLITDNLCTRNIRYGLHFMYSPRNRFYRNRFIDNQTGVAVMYSNRIDMKANHFTKSWGRSSYGLLLKDISDSQIDENLFEANTIGIFADGSSRNHFIRNTLRYNGWAVTMLGSTERNQFVENNFIANFFNVSTNSQTPQTLFESNYWSDYNGYDLNRDGWGDVPFRPMRLFSLWVSRYPELVVLFGSPVIEFLEIAERTFPILTPVSLQDQRPKMRPIRL